MFNPGAVHFQANKESVQVTYANPEQAALVVALAEIGVNGSIKIPTSAADCAECSPLLAERLRDAEKRFSELAMSRTGTQSLQEKTQSLLLQWYIHGKS